MSGRSPEIITSLVVDLPGTSHTPDKILAAVAQKAAEVFGSAVSITVVRWLTGDPARDSAVTGITLPAQDGLFPQMRYIAKVSVASSEENNHVG